MRTDGAEVILPDSEFKLFLRLVVALYETADGFVERGSFRQGGGLAGEGFYLPEEQDQAVNRLRARLGPALRGIKATQFVEVKRGRSRLSTHRRYTFVNTEGLMSHPDAIIQSLARSQPKQKDKH